MTHKPLNKALAVTIIGLLQIASLQAATVKCPADCDVFCPTIKSYCPPPQGRYKSRQMVGTSHLVHNHEDEMYHAMFSVATGYMRNFKGNKITQCLFGQDLVVDSNVNNKCDTPSSILIQGLQVPDRDPRAWLADYFYLPTDFESIVTFSPRIVSYFVDLDLYLNFDSCLTGFYLRFFGPLIHTRWNLGLCENITEPGTLAHPEGYFSPNEISRDDLLSSFTSYAEGKTVATLQDTPDDAIVFQGLKAARMSPFSQSRTAFADLRVELGWNVWQCEDYHIGINTQAAIPTGGKKDSCLMFAPVVGNGNHWEVGAGVTGHFRCYSSEDEECYVALALDANVTHLFKARELRAFDLRGKPNSAYMLAAKFGPNGGNPNTEKVGGTGSAFDPNIPTEATSQFNFEYAPVANLTACKVDVSIEAMANVVLMLNIKSRWFTFDIGYEFWGHSCEIICPKDPFCEDSCRTGVCATTSSNQWALKGDARMFGFMNSSEQPSLNGTPVALSATESKADIHMGTNLVLLDSSFEDVNRNVDNQDGPANAVLEPPLVPPPELVNQPGSEELMNTSLQPVLLKGEDIDLTRVRRMSNRVFAHFNLSCEKVYWTPFVGVGGFVEFGKNDPCIPERERLCRSTCIDCSLSQWGIWLKTGMTFN